jgi:hypothetical protein
MMADHKDRLAEILTRLDEADRESVLAFAEFLASRKPSGAQPAPVAEPEPIPRPQRESVVAALRRLSETYHMLDKSTVLHESSGLMSQHIMQGRDAVEVIDELEVVFRRHYESYLDRKEGSGQ